MGTDDNCDTNWRQRVVVKVTEINADGSDKGNIGESYDQRVMTRRLMTLVVVTARLMLTLTTVTGGFIGMAILNSN